ncbi:hypothetical protein MTR67_049494 [Solanum verrucosum]|uniref:Uncharacterized protein n=1 Tax=Solanum verrucosum TaxID=315347 RepID=A0AAF0V2K5_SOLVR|nr:hypothetical protein MTR67_049494 [Solanum verrucosum]
MDQVVHRPDLTFPPGLSWKNVPHANDGGRLSVAQLSHFDCGGMAISVCMSHKDSLMPSLPDGPLSFPLCIPFQELDFGWGRPTRASIAITPFSNMIYLMNTQDQNKGIEVFINLNQQQMSIFEQDKEFLQFASPVGDNVHEDKEKYCMEAF